MSKADQLGNLNYRKYVNIIKMYDLGIFSTEIVKMQLTVKHLFTHLRHHRFSLVQLMNVL